MKMVVKLLLIGMLAIINITETRAETFDPAGSPIRDIEIPEDASDQDGDYILVKDTCAKSNTISSCTTSSELASTSETRKRLPFPFVLRTPAMTRQPRKLCFEGHGDLLCYFFTSGLYSYIFYVLLVVGVGLLINKVLYSRQERIMEVTIDNAESFKHNHEACKNSHPAYYTT